MVRHTGRLGHIRKRPVAVVSKELARGNEPPRRFIADIQIEVAVVVVVAPGCRLTRVVHLAEPRIERHIGEGPVTVVPQQGVGMPAEIAKPRTSQDEEVHVAIVVVIGLDDVQASVQTEEPRFGRALREGPVLIVSEEAELPRVSHVDTTMSR